MSYPSELRDEEWEIIKEYFAYKKKGRKIKIDRRSIVNAIFYQSRTGCQWQYLPKEYPNYKIVNEYYNKWNRRGLWQKINEELVSRCLESMGKKSKSENWNN
ncbi:transposase [Rickettsia endosymbiont of Ceutorhynchus obstrictus]|uniref:transposase n=1 Tax=Rickettsia endosymbiont of Ceutorhynchus obstrictus TaxID=3066249 RepID=UPI0031332731